MDSPICRAFPPCLTQAVLYSETNILAGESMSDDSLENRVSLPPELSKVLEDFLEDKKTDQLRPNTLHLYRTILERFLSAIGKHPKDITLEDWKEYRRTISGQPTTRNLHETVIKVLLNWSENGQLSKKWKKTRMPKTEPHPLSFDDEPKFLECLKTHHHKAYYHATRFCLWQGLRYCEMKNLNVEDIDREGKTLCVRGGKGDKDRVIALTPEALEAFDLHMEWRRISDIKPKNPEDANAAFLTQSGVRLQSRNWHNHLKNAAIAADIEPPTIHQLRHTALTRIYSLSLDLLATKEFAGHVALSTTLRYAKPSQLKLQAVLWNRPKVGDARSLLVQ